MANTQSFFWSLVLLGGIASPTAFSQSGITPTAESLDPVPEIHVRSVGSNPEPFRQKDGGLGLLLMQAGNRAWDIVLQNRPTAEVELSYASALPQAATVRWESVSGWQPERSFEIEVAYKNLFGQKVIRFSYQVRMIFGGNLNGKGMYIASARVLPTEVLVLWGYNLDVKVRAPQVVNVATPDDPIAAVQLDVVWRVSTLVQSLTLAQSYWLQGDGLMKDPQTERIFHPKMSSIPLAN